MTSFCTVFEVLVTFLLPVSKCSWRFLSEFPNSIRMAWKFPLLDAVLVLSSRWPLRGMFCLPHNIMVLMIALSAFMFFPNISWFCVEILYGKVSFGFWTLRIMAMPASSAHWWHCIFWWRSSTLSFPVAFSSYWNGAVTRGLFCARGSDGLLSITQYLQKPPICEGLYTSHVYFSYHEGWNTCFLVCLSFPLTTVLEKKPVYEGGGVKWFLRYLNFSWDWGVLGSTLPLTMSPTSK